MNIFTYTVSVTVILVVDCVGFQYVVSRKIIISPLYELIETFARFRSFARYACLSTEGKWLRFISQ